MTRRIALCRAMLALAVVALAGLVAALAWTGPGLRPAPFAVALAILAAAVAAIGPWDNVRRDLEAAWDGVERASTRLAIVAVCLFTLVAWRWNTEAAGGSDSHCYAGQAEALLRGHVAVDQPLSRTAPWPVVIDTLLPAGFVTSSADPHAAIPICPPGLSLFMAAASLIGGKPAMFLVVPFFGGMLAAATFVIGRRIWNGRVGLLAALLIAASPIVLYQVVQPMSDVPAAALWLTAIAISLDRRRAAPWLAGLATAAAIATRPNLAPLAAAVAVLVGTGAPDARVRSVLWYLLAALPGPIVVALVNASVTGSPFKSGYGDLDALYSLRHVWVNLQRYPAWLIGSHTPFILLAVAAPFRFAWPRRPLAGEACLAPTVSAPPTASAAPAAGLTPPANLAPSRNLVVAENPGSAASVPPGRAGRPEAQDLQSAELKAQSLFSLWALMFAALVLAAYLPYVPFPEWWYLRFLIPALPLLILPACAVLDAAIDRTPRVLRVVCLVVTASLLMTLWVGEARAQHVFELRALERRFIEGGRYIAHATPPEGVVFTVSESGSVRFYSGRQTIAWDVMDPAWLDRAIAFFTDQGRAVYILLEESEEPVFRDRFARTSAYATLDWPPMADIRAKVRVRVWEIAARERFQQGGRVQTQTIWPER